MKKTMRQLIVCILVFSLMVSIVPGIGVSAEDTISSAGSLQINGSWGEEHWISETNKEDWYKIVIPSDGKLTLKIMAYFELGWLLYNSDLSNEIADKRYGDFLWATSSKPKTNAYDYILSEGVYYLYVTGEEGKYKIQASFEDYQVNDSQAVSYDSPQLLPLNTTITGAITETDTEDWYRIHISKSGNYAITIRGYFDLDWYLYNEDVSETLYHDYNEFWGANDIEPVTNHYDKVLSAGTYYIRIHDDTGKYQLSIAPLSQNNCPHDYDSTYVYATYTTRGYTYYKCSKCGKSYKDNYVGKKTLGQGYIYSYGLVSGKRKITVQFSGVSDATGYQIRYSTNKKFASKVKTVRAGSDARTKVLKGLLRKKRYYVQVRGLRKENGKTVYGKWSVRRSVKTK